MQKQVVSPHFAVLRQINTYCHDNTRFLPNLQGLQDLVPLAHTEFMVRPTRDVSREANRLLANTPWLFINTILISSDWCNDPLASGQKFSFLVHFTHRERVRYQLDGERISGTSLGILHLSSFNQIGLPFLRLFHYRIWKPNLQSYGTPNQKTVFIVKHTHFLPPFRRSSMMAAVEQVKRANEEVVFTIQATNCTKFDCSELYILNLIFVGTVQTFLFCKPQRNH